MALWSRWNRKVEGADRISDVMAMQSKTTERAEASRDEALGALNTLVGYASLLARDEPLPADTRARYASHLRASAETVRRILTARADTNAARESTMRIVAAPIIDLEETLAQPFAPSIAPSMPPSIAPSPGTRARVLIVDSDVASRELLAAYLDGPRYEIVLAANAADAIRCASEALPDLVLIDATRADEDGFDIARRLKQSVANESLAVVFVTSFGDGDARTRALDAGAVQFLETPVSRHDLRARVRNLLHLRSEQRVLARQNAELRSLQAFKAEMSALVIHDLKNPLSAMTMNLDVALHEATPGGEMQTLRDALHDCKHSGSRMFRMIANLLDIGRSEDGRLVPQLKKLDVGRLVERIVKQHSVEAASRSVNFRFVASALNPIEADGDLLERVVENLLENAFRFTPPNGNVLVEVREGADLEILVANDGPSIPAESSRRIFEKYEQAGASESRGAHRGLGLYFCDVAIRAHGGRIYLSEEPQYSTCFRVVLPRWEIADATVFPAAMVG